MCPKDVKLPSEFTKVAGDWVYSHEQHKTTHNERQATKEVVPTLKCGSYERQNKIAELFLVKAFQRKGDSLWEK